MDEKQTSILLVDDDDLSLALLNTFLANSGYNIATAADGLKAWQLLEQNPDRFSTVLLDRNMPVMDGMELLKRIKASTKFTNMPVIMQTGADSKEDILEGLRAGAHYYLTKPFDRKTLNSIVDTAVSEYRRYKALTEELSRTASTLNLMTEGRFEFRTLDEGRNISALLSSVCPDPGKVAMGLSELIINAIEHGNLGISYKEKSRLLKNMSWEKEIDHRLELPEYKDKHVTIDFLSSNNHIEFLITDEGEGFDWDNYLTFDPERAFDSHGRGIAMANNMSFSKLEFRGKGNQVLAIIEKNSG
ncbi:MAG: response regulator [Gammaproteobacteria bacterium]